MTYIYENVTEQITLESRLKALSQLQGETLDHLAEAVAVFGTDGRLRLFNPVFAEIWRLSPAMLKGEPHIGEIIADCRALYADTHGLGGHPRGGHRHGPRRARRPAACSGPTTA